MDLISGRYLSKYWHYGAYFTAFSLVVYLSYLWRNYQLDDALIYLRYIRNFVDGNGFVYNYGEYFNGLTSPLYSYLVIILSFVAGKNNLQYLSVFLSSVFFLSSILLSLSVFFREKTIWYYLMVVVLGVFPYFYSTYGMETTLFIMMLNFCLFFYKNEQIFLLGIFSSLLIITRVEGVFLLVPMLFIYIKNKKIPELKYYVFPVIIILINVIFNKFYYGSLMPSTGMAKIWQGKSGLWGDEWVFLDIGYFFGAVFKSNYYFLVAFLASVYISLLGLLCKKYDEIDLIVFLFLLLYSCFYLFFNIPNYHWYYAPYFYFGLCYIIIGTSKLFEMIINKKNQWVGVFVILLPISIMSWCAFGVSNNYAGGVNKDYKKIGEWLRKNTPKDAKIAMVEIGTVGWYSERYIVDILGLVNPYNAEFIGEKRFAKWFKLYNPDYLLVHDPLWKHEISAKVFVRNDYFKKDNKFYFPGFLLLERTNKPKVLISDYEFDDLILYSSNEKISFTQKIQMVNILEVAGGECAIDAINGDNIQQSVTVERDKLVSVNGWAVDLNSKSVPDMIVRLRNETDYSLSYYAAVLDRVARKDVGNYFHNPVLEISGFDVSADFSGIPKGQYYIELLQSVGNKLLVCPNRGRVNIRQ